MNNKKEAYQTIFPCIKKIKVDKISVLLSLLHLPPSSGVLNRHGAHKCIHHDK